MRLYSGQRRFATADNEFYVVLPKPLPRFLTYVGALTGVAVIV